MVMNIFKFENRTSDGEIFCRSEEMTLQYISYSTVHYRLGGEIGNRNKIKWKILDISFGMMFM